MNKKGDITINTNEIQRIIWQYFENLYLNRLEGDSKMVARGRKQKACLLK
jgi:hypothetical protein